MILQPSSSIVPFSNVLRERTADLHRQAERSGVVAAILAGQITVRGYALFLRNLLPAYQAMEAGLEAHRHLPEISGLFRPEVFRAAAIAKDLSFLAGPSWYELALLPAAAHYAERVASCANTAPPLLVAHAYTRYLGDLGGGQILRHLLKSALKLDEDGLEFYAFPQLPDVRAFANTYRSAIDFSARDCGDVERVVEEATLAFGLNIELSEAVEAFLRTK